MTNNTQLLNCPFCGTDDVDPTGVLNGDETRSPECMGCGATAPTVATWNCRITAPAEDVRAVVEEPVAWMQFDGEGNNDFTDDHETAERWARNNGPKYADWLTPLYRQPQRPVVLPERKPKTELGIYRLEDEGYNACLDDIDRLSK